MANNIVSEDVKRKILQSTIYFLTSRQPFYGSLLQELGIQYTDKIEHICLDYNKEKAEFVVLINPNYFNDLTAEERLAVFLHETMHFSNKHVFRLPFIGATPEQMRVYNIAGDMAINQFITGLPKGAVDVFEWIDDYGNPFPTFQSMECYYDLIRREQSREKDKNRRGKGNVQKMVDDYTPMDEHYWGDLTETQKQEMLEEAKKIVKRTIEKSSSSHTTIPNGIKELLEEIESIAEGLNYKQIIKSTIKRTVSCADRENTWKKPNKRYGAYSPGTKVGALPKLTTYIDSSGSISIKEANLFLSIVCEFLKVGVRTCDLGLWHTELYYKKKYKLGTDIAREDFESGGTDVECVLADIKKCKPDLAIILTDGYYDHVDINIATEVIWIISEGGQIHHPMQHLGKTIPLEKLKA